MENEWCVLPDRLFCRNFKCERVTLLVLKFTFQIGLRNKKYFWEWSKFGRNLKRENCVCRFAILPYAICKICYYISFLSNNLFGGGETNFGYIHPLLWGRYFCFCFYFNWMRWLSSLSWMNLEIWENTFIFMTHKDPWMKSLTFSWLNQFLFFLLTLCFFLFFCF